VNTIFETRLNIELSMIATCFLVIDNEDNGLTVTEIFKIKQLHN